MRNPTRLDQLDTEIKLKRKLQSYEINWKIKSKDTISDKWKLKSSSQGSSSNCKSIGHSSPIILNRISESSNQNSTGSSSSPKSNGYMDRISFSNHLLRRPRHCFPNLTAGKGWKLQTEVSTIGLRLDRDWTAIGRIPPVSPCPSEVCRFLLVTSFLYPSCILTGKPLRTTNGDAAASQIRAGTDSRPSGAKRMPL